MDFASCGYAEAPRALQYLRLVTMIFDKLTSVDSASPCLPAFKNLRLGAWAFLRWRSQISALGPSPETPSPSRSPSLVPFVCSS